MPATVEYSTIGTIVSPWPPSTKAVTSSTLTLNSSARKWRKRALSSTPAMPTTMWCGRPENSRSAQTIASSGLVMQMTKAVGRMGADALADRLHHLEVDAEQVVAAHARLAGDAGGDDADVGAGDVGIVGRALEPGVEVVDRPGLGDVERLALGNAFGDVEQDDVAKLAHRREVGERAADHSGADERDLLPSHEAAFLAFVVSRRARGVGCSWSAAPD